MILTRNVLWFILMRQLHLLGSKPFGPNTIQFIIYKYKNIHLIVIWFISIILQV